MYSLNQKLLCHVNYNHFGFIIMMIDYLNDAIMNIYLVIVITRKNEDIYLVEFYMSCLKTKWFFFFLLL